MSVDFSTRVGFGYMLTPDEHQQMIDYAEEHDMLGEVEDEFMCLDSWSGGNYFLGEVFSTVEPGEYVTMDVVIYPPDFNPELFARRMEEILTICGVSILPETKWDNPKLYVMHIVS